MRSSCVAISAAKDFAVHLYGPNGPDPLVLIIKVVIIWRNNSAFPVYINEKFCRLGCEKLYFFFLEENKTGGIIFLVAGKSLTVPLSRCGCHKTQARIASLVKIKFDF